MSLNFKLMKTHPPLKKIQNQNQHNYIKKIDMKLNKILKNMKNILNKQNKNPKTWKQNKK